MEKEPKKSDSLTRNNIELNTMHDFASLTGNTAVNTSSKAAVFSYQKSNPFVILSEELRAMLFNGKGFLKIDYFTLFWLFVGGSIIGLGLETLYHAIALGGYESRAGLVWGPFSPIYGVGAVVLTAFLNRYYHSHNLVVFLIAMVVGSLLEYITSWGMEVFWGAIAWDYTGTFGSIQGRTNFFFGLMWGMLGLLWVRLALPLVKKVFEYIDSQSKTAKTLTLLMSVFIAINIIFTCLAVNREQERVNGIPANNSVRVFLDAVFPDEYLNSRFENMTIMRSNTPESERPKPLLPASPF